MVGNALLIAMIQLMLAHLVAGSAAWMEHPIPAHWRLEAVTSWTWEPLLAIQSCPVATTTDFDQCEHGSEAGRAPTRIVGLRVSGLHQRLTATPGRGRCSHGQGAHQTLLGKREGGGPFRTAAKKVYPPGLCRALAESVVQTVADFASLELEPGSEAIVPSPGPEVDGLRDFFVGAVPEAEEGAGEWAPDFCRRYGRRKPDPERGRFQRPSHAQGTSQAPGQESPQDLAAQGSGPPSAEVDSQEEVFAVAVGLESPFAPPSSPPPPPPPPPPLLTEAQRERIRANRDEARRRRHLKRAPWVAQGLEFHF